jgi:ABC-type dipeptide/oligopeptide/nickel transport system ATPase subunit
MKVFIGLVGEKGSGKDTFAEALQEYVKDHSIERCRSSDILGETLDMWHLPKTRHNLQQMAIVMDSGFGKGTLTNALCKRISAMNSDIIIFDAVRWMSDVDMVRSFPCNFLVYITADIKTRYERTRQRKQKIGEATTSFEEFVKDESISTETDTPQIGAKADVKIENTDDIAKFKALVVQFYQQKVLPALMRQ